MSRPFYLSFEIIVNKICLTLYAILSIILSAFKNAGVSPSGKASDSDSDIRWFESIHPSHFYFP